MYKENIVLRKLGWNALIQGSAFWGIQILLGNWIAFRLWWAYAIWLAGVFIFTFTDIKRDQRRAKRMARQ